MCFTSQQLSSESEIMEICQKLIEIFNLKGEGKSGDGGVGSALRCRSAHRGAANL